MNIATFIVLIVFIAIVFKVLKTMFQNKKAGRSMCGGNCGSCHTSSLCHQSETLINEYRKRGKTYEIK